MSESEEESRPPFQRLRGLLPGRRFPRSSLRRNPPLIGKSNERALRRPYLADAVCRRGRAGGICYHRDEGLQAEIEDRVVLCFLDNRRRETVPEEDTGVVDMAGTDWMVSNLE